MDKEQMAESGGDDWSRILAKAQTRAFYSVFFLSNAYCGSEECLKELQYSDIKKFDRVPCFLEALGAADCRVPRARRAASSFLVLASK